MGLDEKDKAALDDFTNTIAEIAETDRLKNEINRKKAVLDHKRITDQYNRMEEDEKELDIIGKANLSELTYEQIKKVQKENMDYLTAATRCMTFINPEFDGVIPFFQKNVILVGASSGEGKSTVAANIASSVMKDINPLTGKQRKVLIITNEEKSEDFYNRITALDEGWHYSNHAKFTDQQRERFDKAIPILAKDGWLTVIADDYGGGTGATTTFEGLKQILNKLLEEQVHYDVIIIDYYQNIITSTKNPDWNEYMVQDRFCKALDQFKNKYPAPIVVLAQCRPESTQNPKPFKERVEGRKTIFNTATCAIEIIANKKLLMSQWTPWKNRFNTGTGECIKTGFKKGLFVKYDTAFQESVEKARMEMALRMQAQEESKEAKLTDVFKKEGNNE